MSKGSSGPEAYVSFLIHPFQAHVTERLFFSFTDYTYPVGYQDPVKLTR